MTTPLRARYVDDDPRNQLFRVQRQAFLDPEVFAAERERIFDRSWLYLGHESEIRAFWRRWQELLAPNVTSLAELRRAAGR